MTTDVEEYAPSVKWIHWTVATIMLLMLSASFFIDALPKPMVHNAIQIHKSLGLTVLLLMLFRLIWVPYKGKPALPKSMPLYERLLARLVQFSMYFFVIAMVLVGLTMSFASDKATYYLGLFYIRNPGIPVSKDLADTLWGYHEEIAYILIGLISLHVLGALKHHFYDKNDVLKRMM